MYITSSDRSDFLSAQEMKAVNNSKIAELLAIPLHVERPHDTIPGVTIGELGGPLYGFVQLIVKVLNETGTILASSGYPNLGAFVAETLKESSRGPTQPDANVDFVLERVCALFLGGEMRLVDCYFDHAAYSHLSRLSRYVKSRGTR